MNPQAEVSCSSLRLLISMDYIDTVFMYHGTCEPVFWSAAVLAMQQSS